MSASGLALGTSAALIVVGTASPRRTSLSGRSIARGHRPSTTSRLRLTPRQVAALGALVLVTGAVVPPLGFAVLAAPFARRWTNDRRDRRARARALGVALPETVDLLLLCAGAGMSLPLSLPLVAARAPAPVGEALRAAERDVTGGGSRADALHAHLGALGDRGGALAHVLVDHLRYGVPLVPGLERAALELRLARRRHAEEEARRLPVRLLAPLLTCVLPAFVLLTVVPLLVAALRSLPR
jgi:Flp pilus assembly protein TadB